MNWDRSFLVTLVYSLFTVLYTIFIITHPGYFRMHKGPHWAYFLEFLLIGNYGYFILQGLLLRSKNWGLLLLLPLGLCLAVVLAGYLLVGLIRLGGGDLLDRDSADMLLACFLLIAGSYFSLRFIRPKKSRR